jgi:hypothetical protein
LDRADLSALWSVATVAAMLAGGVKPPLTKAATGRDALQRVEHSISAF